MAADNDQAVIEREFFQSWDSMAYYFTRISADSHREWLRPLVKLMVELRERGYDRELLAAQSMTTFILRRHRGHIGLPLGKPTISIHTTSNGSIDISYRGIDGEAKLEPERLEFTPELEALLQRLLAHPID